MVTTITTTAAEDARIAVAFGHVLGLPGNTNAAQVKAYLATVINRVVTEDEARVAALAASPTPIQPT
jgi:hypothetical protein